MDPVERYLEDVRLTVTAGWAHGGKVGITMSGKGRLAEREFSSAERNAIAQGAKTLGLAGEQVFALLYPQVDASYAAVKAATYPWPDG